MFEITKLSKIPLCRILPIPTKNLCLHGVATAENKSSTCSPPACNALNLKVQSPSPVADKVLVGSKVTELKWEEMTVECYNGASGGSLFLGQAGSGGVSVGIACQNDGLYLRRCCFCRSLRYTTVQSLLTMQHQ